MAATLMSYVPEFIYSSKIFAAVYAAQGTELDTLETAIAGIATQCFVSTATWGLKYWEEFLGITVDETKETDYRRSAILAKIRGTGTTTKAMVKNVAASFSNGTVEVVENSADYSFVIKFTGTLGIPPNLDDLSAIIEIIKPAHLAFSYAYTYRTWNMVSSYTWDSLSSYTWDEVKEGDIS
jgi:uncharacterized protein YmfQ (DUF2313 family)